LKQFSGSFVLYGKPLSMNRYLPLIATSFSVVVFFLGISCQRDQTPLLEYEIVNGRVDSLPALEVRMHFSPDSGRVTYVNYENDAWGETDLFNGIRNVRLLQGQGAVSVEPDSGRIRIEHPLNPGSLALSYTVFQDIPGPKNAQNTYRPIVESSYFHVYSHNLFAIPRHYWKGENPEADIRLEWTGWGPGEVIHNSFGSQNRLQDLGQIPLERFHNAIFVGGDFRIYTEEVEGNELILAIRGDWVPFQDPAVMDLLTETIRAQRDFWNDHSQPYFTVTMRPYPQENGTSFQGTGLTNSFATSISNNAETEFEQLAYLFNHELMHNWIGFAIKNADEEAQYWFSEGFTDYYTSKNMAAYGIDGKDWGYFITKLNETIRELEASSVREAPNEEINYDNFWKNPEYGKLPYRRGKLFACYLDLHIQAVSGGERSLDDVMRDLLAATRKDGQVLTHAHFLRTANAYLAQDLTPFFERHIIQGETLPMKTLFEQLGLAYEEEETDLFDLGIRFNENVDAVVSVDPTSEAFRAGVREGDRVVSRSIYRGSISKEAELILEREGKQIPVAYRPVKKARVVQLLDNEANRARFRK